VVDASSAAATAALSRRRKQSRPRQLASSADSENSTDNQGTDDDAFMNALHVDSLISLCWKCLLYVNPLKGRGVN